MPPKAGCERYTIFLCDEIPVCVSSSVINSWLQTRVQICDSTIHYKTQESTQQVHLPIIFLGSVVLSESVWQSTVSELLSKQFQPEMVSCPILRLMVRLKIIGWHVVSEKSEACRLLRLKCHTEYKPTQMSIKKVTRVVADFTTRMKKNDCGLLNAT